MDSDAAERPRTWVPVVGAGVAALAVVGAALAWYVVAGGPSETERAAIEACELAYGLDTTPAIVAGQVFTPDQWREYYEAVELNGDVAIPLEELPSESVDAWEAQAQAHEESGDGTVAIVWRFEDDTFGQCVVEVSGAGAGAAQVGPLEIG